jgi:hypothetical protein
MQKVILLKNNMALYYGNSIKNNTILYYVQYFKESLYSRDFFIIENIK